MRAGTPSATHVVSFLQPPFFCRPASMCCVRDYGLHDITGLYYKLHGVHRPTTMKKATIKRRKRVIPAGEEEDGDESSQPGGSQEPQPKMEETEKGSMNADGSVNLGSRRAPRPEPMALEPRRPVNDQRQPSPLSVTSDLAAYHQQSLRPSNPMPYLSDENRLPPISSMHVSHPGPAVDRQSSTSPSAPAYLSPGARKRSFSYSENEGRGAEENTGAGSDHSKRLSSIKSILNPSSSGRYDDMNDYSLPPLRSPAATVNSVSSPAVYSRDPTPAMSEAYAETDAMKMDRRAALQREAEQMREMLAAKERELNAMRH